ncbi:MAG: hypothetical protein K0Q55_1426 [Verrucomicrobia bacterium]|jgi:hypothetical protein|nr:hypothetical protein [Verrucomicrobiota bacterium]
MLEDGVQSGAEGNAVGSANGSAEHCTYAKHRQFREKGSRLVRALQARAGGQSERQRARHAPNREVGRVATSGVLNLGVTPQEKHRRRVA